MTSEPSAWLPAAVVKLCYWCQSAPRRYGNRCAECAGKGETAPVARPEPTVAPVVLRALVAAPVASLRVVSTYPRVYPKIHQPLLRSTVPSRPSCEWPDCEARAERRGYCRRCAYRVSIVGSEGDLRALWAEHRLIARRNQYNQQLLESR